MIVLPNCNSSSSMWRGQLGSADYSPKAIIEQLNEHYRWYTENELKLILPPELSKSKFSASDDKVFMPCIVFPGYHCISSEEHTFRALLQIIEDQFDGEEAKLPSWLEFDLVNFRRMSSVDLRPKFGLAEVDFMEMTVNEYQKYLRTSDMSNFAGSQGLMIYIALRRKISNIMGRSAKLQIVMPGCQVFDGSHRICDSPSLYLDGYMSKPELVPFLGSNFENTKLLYPRVNLVSI